MANHLHKEVSTFFIRPFVIAIFIEQKNFLFKAKLKGGTCTEYNKRYTIFPMKSCKIAT